ncbi:NUDIX hydrolase [Phanerochaete sordida]|uniref:NUDIX hydrolase n=1 Tax=Phanerochaete sordida TaxID=48140 RepID=A0A9P3G2K5_9APHY|nr:NUDIX hydrolase [Phanerochaete sordida]
MAPQKTPEVPRPSASLIVVNSRNEILLVHRNPKSSAFAGMHVFPGGNFDVKQDEDLVQTAIRETFEETGLLLAEASDGKRPNDQELDKARDAVHAQKLLFRDFLAQHRLALDRDALLPFTQWVTPPNVPRRFQTQFYVTFLDSAPASGFAAGDKVERIPTPDGGQEVVAARFVHPAAALRECAARQIALMPPQFYLVTTLAAVLHGDACTAAQREKVRELSQGPFGRLVINPRPLPSAAHDGWSVLTYEGDESRGGAKGRLHRSLVKFVKPGVVSEVVLQRNFDVFTEIEEVHPHGEAKL